MKIMALTGPKGSGKDTVADIICKHYTSEWHNVARLAFADPIKRMVQHIFQLDPSNNRQYDDFKRTELHYSVPNTITRDMIMMSVPGRHVVREIGMMMREYDEKQFNRYVEDHFLRSEFKTSKVFVITDLRFDNEYTMLKNWKAKIIKVDRPGYHYDGHITERGFDDSLVDFVIHNDGSLTDLTVKTKEIITQLEKGWK